MNTILEDLTIIMLKAKIKKCIDESGLVDIEKCTMWYEPELGVFGFEAKIKDDE